mgnify:FL=1
MINFLEMSGYGQYIWTSYGFTLILLSLIWFLSSRFAKTSEEKLSDLITKSRSQMGKDGNETEI